MEQPSPPSETGVLAGINSLVRNIFGLVFNRLELASLEFAEARHHFLKLLLVAALGLVAGIFALAYWSVLLVFLSWDALGWKILLILAAFFTALGWMAFRYAQNQLEQGKLSMPATMAELRNDRETLI
jgi:uncharacterized membrane protein YqjE